MNGVKKNYNSKEIEYKTSNNVIRNYKECSCVFHSVSMHSNISLLSYLNTFVVS